MTQPTASTSAQADSEAGQAPRWLVSAVQILAIAIAAFAIFRLGSLWSLRGFAQAQAPGPNPFLAAFPRYVLAVLWPVPGAVLLFLAAGGFGRRTPRWWLFLVAAGLWFAVYLLIKPPEMYYYWLTPVQ